MNKLPNIALLSYNKNKYSETFIQNQAKYLEGNIHYLYGGELPEFYGNDLRFLKSGLISRLRSFVLQRSLHEQHLMAVEKYFLKHNINVVLANYALTAFPVMEICRANNIPLIVHFHGWTAYRKSILEKYAAEYARLFEIAKVIIVVSDDMQKQLEYLGAPSEKIHVLRCGADEDLFKYTDHTNTPPVFFSPGRFCETKNPELTIRAFYIALKKLSDARLIMAGGDEGKLISCIALVKELGIEDKVEFKGVISHEQVQEFMRTSTALVVHYTTTTEGEKEGTPVTVLEAALSGLPIVATRHAGVAEIFEHNKNALLCEEFDIDVMASNMIKVVSDKSLSKNITESAFTVVSNNFTSKLYIKSLDAIVANCTSG